MRPQVAYITADPGTDPDLIAALPALDHAGLDVHPVPWDAGFQWADADLVLVGSPHDVGRRRPEFLRWARHVEEHTRLANAALTLVRNTDRTYLRDLPGRGVPVVDTVWFEPGDTEQECAEAVAGLGWAECQVCAATCDPMEATSHEGPVAAAAAAAAIAAGGTVAMIRSGAVASARVGMVLLAGRVSHAVTWQGPEPSAFTPDAELARQALAFAGTAAGGDGLLYARVDLVEDAGRWKLLELQATSADLFLRAEPRAAQAYAHAVRQWVMPEAQAADFLAASG